MHTSSHIGRYLLFCMLFIIGQQTFAQLTVTPSNVANTLAQELVGQGVVVSNAQLFSDPTAQGFFDGTNSNIGIDSGIVLTSGRAIDAQGPNTSTGITWDNTQPGDPLLDALAGTNTQDRCELRFDVTPFSDTMRFRYVFASDEYPEYVCSNFNDAFGFFVSGPNPAGGNYNDVNVAIIPNSTLPVAINTVNPGVAGGSSGGGSCQSLAYSSLYVNNNTQGSGTVEYDGFTVVLTAVIPVVKCQTYTLRLMVGDAGDGAWDSGVFLESGSLNATGVSVTAQTDAGLAYTNVIEGCLDGSLTFVRGTNDTAPVMIFAQYGGTAQNGMDYQSLPDTIIIPANQDTLTLPIVAFQDNIYENFEVLKILIRLPCSSEVLDSAVINIVDSLSIQLTPDTTVCLGSSIQLSAIGGANFSWSPGTYLNTTSISTPTATPQQTITYTVSSSLFSCAATDSVTLTVNTTPQITVGPDTGVCTGNSLLLPASGVAQSYQWSPPIMLSNPFVRNPSALPPSTTTYTLVASNGICRDTGTVQVQVYPLPIVDAGQSKFICAGDTAQMQATGGVTYNWQPAGSLTNNTIANPGAFPSSTTVYTVTITDSNGCSRQDFVQVGVLPAPNIQAGSDKVVCAGSATMLTVTGGTSYTWQPANSLNNNTIANPTATPTATTQYIVEGLGGNGCSATDTVVVQVSPYPTSTVSASPPVVCPNDTVQLSAMGGSTYQWQPASLVSNASIANPQSVLAQDTMLYVQVTDSNGCSVMDSILLQTHNLPVISSGGGDSICQGESTTLQAAGGISYNWAPGSSLSSTTVASPVATPSTTTTYTLSVTDANGCSNTDQLTVVVLPTPTAQAGPDLTLCEGAATSLQASGGTSYQWSPGTDLSCTQCANPVVVPTQSRTYTVQVTDTFGCTDEDDININIVPLPATQVSASPAGICPGGQVQLTASGGVGYQWSPAASLSNPSIAQPTARPTATTWYTVQITDTTGCVATDSVRVSVFNLPNLSAGQDQVICASGAVQLQATGAVTYQWSPGTGLSQTTGATVTASPTVTTQYTLTGTDANGCTKQDTVEVAVHPLPTAQAGADIFACENEVVQLNGSGGSQYSWTPGSGLSCSSCPNPQLNVSTNRTYVLQVTDANGCSDTDTLQVNALPAPQLSTGPDTTICPNSMVALNTQSNAVSYTWSPTAGLSNPNTASPTASPAGSVVYTLQATGANGCISTDSVSIQLFPGSQVTTGADTAICAGEQVTLTASAMASYQWSPDSSLSDNSIRRPVASPNVTTTYTVFSTDLNGCTSTATQRVTVHPIPNLQLTTTDTTICVGTSVTLGVSGANTYQWNPANTLSNANSNAPVASPLQQTIYTILGTSGQNCTASATVEVDFYPLVTTGLPASASMCPNDSVPLKAEGGIQYTWQPTNGLSDPSSASPLASPDADIVYTLLMIDTNQCTVRDSVAITVWPDPDADAGADQTIFTGESTTLWGSGNGSLQWTPGQYLDDPAAAQPTATPDSSTLFHLVVTSQEGCIDTDAVFIKVLFPTVVYVPNAFSPNGDGQNDLIGPVTFNDFELEYFQVYNRWGQLVFETADATARWDGTMGGVPQPIGTYVYLLRGKGNRGEPFVKQGNITLFR